MEATSASASARNVSSGRAPRSPFARLRTATAPLGRLAIAHHQHVGDLLQLGLANLVVDLLLSVVDLRLQAAPGQGGRDLAGIVQMAVGDGQDDGLDRRQPQWEGAGEVLDQDGDEPLEAAENGAVNHHRPVLGVVGADVLQVEALRRDVVQLDRGALPLPADRVGDVEVDLRARRTRRRRH